MPKKIVNVEKGKQGFQRTQSRTQKPPTPSSRPLLHPTLKPSTPPKDERDLLAKEDWKDSPLWHKTFGENNLVFKYDYGDFGLKRTKYGTNLFQYQRKI